jgi:hypothetical protein
MTRLECGKWFDLEFEIEPFPYTRLNQNSRWTSGPGSQEQEYIGWKDRIRDNFDQLNYQVQTWGLPLHEPINLKGQFWVTENFEGKDLDNLAKGIIDAMNPSRRKDWKDLRTFFWVDDKQVMQHSGFLKVPSSVPKILLQVQTLWGREDPNLNFVTGEIDFDGRWFIKTTSGYPFYIDIVCSDSERAELKKGVEQGWDTQDGSPTTATLWVWPYSQKGVYKVFLRKETLFLFRQFHTIKGLSTLPAETLIRGTEWNSILEGLITGNAKNWSSLQGRASLTLGRIREQLSTPSNLSLLAQKFDPELFETTAHSYSQEYGTPWGSVRDRLRNANICWTEPSDPVLAIITQQLATERDARMKAKKK